MGGPRNASDPVCGSSDPSLSVRSAAGLSLPPLSELGVLLLQPAMTMADALISAIPAKTFAVREPFNAFMMLPCVTERGL